MKSIELFAGAGGLGMGLHQAGFRPIAVIERDIDCCATIRANQGLGQDSVRDWPVIQGDVREIDFSRFEGRIDLVSGGPPCQPFSLGGRHRAHDDRRDMFPEAIRAVRQVRPKAFIFENVKGLTRAAFREYFDYIALQLRHPDVGREADECWSGHLARLRKVPESGIGLRYDVHARLLNAADHGAPQRRERVFFVGFRADLEIDWRFPPSTHGRDALLRDQASGAYWDRHGLPRPKTPRARLAGMDSALLPWRTVRDALDGLPDPERDPTADTIPNHRFQPGARSYPGHTGSDLDSPAKTLKAGVHGVPGGENMLRRPDGSIRYFTIRETARLQTFPDDYVFHGAWSEAMRQLGNAAPVLLARAVGGAVAEALRGADSLRSRCPGNTLS